MAHDPNNENEWEAVKGKGDGGPFRKPWVKPGDFLVGIFLGFTVEDSKFGGKSTIIRWQDDKTDELFRTRAQAKIARMAQDGDFEEGGLYKITFLNLANGNNGFQFKDFDTKRQKRASPF